MKVSVWMSAYNHEKYIAQCLDAVLMQKTTFDYEIILGEDCSTDRTREIVIAYQKRYPDKIHLFLPEQNIGMMRMDVETWKLCSGEYIALLNGDDFWTDENKLQTQVDFLESNPDTVMCFHKAKVEYETTGYSFETVFPESGNILPIESLLKGYNPIMTPTVMFKNVLDIPEWYADLPTGDMPTYLLLAQKGKIKYIDKLMSVYRIHSNGDWQGDSIYNNLLKHLKFYRIINEKLNYKFDYLIKKIFAQRYFDLVIYNIKSNNFGQAKRYFKKLSLSDSDFIKKNKRDMIRIYKILYEGIDAKQFGNLLEREVKWKVN